MEYKKIAVIGAGAVGAYFIWGFSSLQDISFCVVAEGDRRERLIRDGVTINDVLYRPEVKTPEEAKGADLILVTTKYQGLESTLPMLERMVEAHTVVVSLLNGIDSEEIIGERIGHEHLIYSVMRVQSTRRGGKIHFVPETTIGVTIGEKNKEVTERVKVLDALFDRAGMHHFIAHDILKDQWSKYAMNITYNLPQAILGVGFGAYYDSEHVAHLSSSLWQEVCAVAKAEGIPDFHAADWRSACKKPARFSTLQDLDEGRHTEIDMFCGALIRLAAKHGIAVPYNEYTYHAIKALEEKNDGKFDYRS